MAPARCGRRPAAVAVAATARAAARLSLFFFFWFAPCSCGGRYVKVLSARCAEVFEARPLRAVSEGDALVRTWCNEQDWCNGYTRPVGGDDASQEAAAGRGTVPRFCGDARDLAYDDGWVSYLRTDVLERLWRDDEEVAAAASEEEDGTGHGSHFIEGAAEDVDAAGGAATLRRERIECAWPYGGEAALWLVDRSTEVGSSEEVGAEDSGDAELDECNVLHHAGGPWPALPPGAGPLHGVLSEDVGWVEYFAADTSMEPWRYFVESNDFIGDTLSSGNASSFGPKLHYISFFFLSADSACPGKTPQRWTPDEVRQFLPEHVYVDDGSVETRRQAFQTYHFTTICGSLNDAGYVPQALVDAVGLAAHPLIAQDLHRRLQRVFFHLPDAAQPYTRIHPLVLEQYAENLHTDPEKNDAMHFKQTFLFLLQELFRYRYRQPPDSRLQAAACALCEERRRRRRLEEALAAAARIGDGASHGDAAAAVGIAVCVMSRRGGHALRAAIRETWATKLGDVPIAAGSATLRFFVGKVVTDGHDGSLEGLADAAIADAEHGDVVELEVPESYKAVTLKAFSMLHWTSRRFPNLRFMVRADDDVYLRPGPLFAQLERRPPVAYLWGNFDHGSNPIRDAEHPHYNSQEQFPERRHPMFGDIFPPYARGHLWVMSADLVTMVADVWLGELRHHLNASLVDLLSKVPHPDDPALGVALNNLVEFDRLSLNIDDRDLNSFALNPSCNATFLNITSRTWVVHHVDPEAIRCMWAIDVAEGVNESRGASLPDLCACSMDVTEEADDEEVPFNYPRQRFNE